MANFTIKSKNEERLHLIKNPSLKSISILIVLLSLAFGAMLYSSDSFLFELLYFFGAFVVGVSLLDDWEECIFDVVEGHFYLKKSSLWQQFNLKNFIDHPFFQKHNEAKFPLKSIMGVVVNKNFQMSSSGKFVRVELLMSSGIKLPLSENWKTSDRIYCEGLSDIIKKFLQLERIQQLTPTNAYESDCSSYDSATSSNSEFSDSANQSLVKEELQHGQSGNSQVNRVISFSG